MAVNVSPEFAQAELKFDRARTDDEKLEALAEMMSTMPGHKGAESLRAQIRTRYKKLKEKIETKGKKSGGRGKPTIKKEAMQAIIIGFPNVGKSSLSEVLTKNKNPTISEIAFSTYEPIVSMMPYDDVQIQTIDSPPFPNEDKSIINTADTLIIVINNLEQIAESEKYIEKSMGERIYVYTKTDLLDKNEKRKLEATLKSKYNNINYYLFSNKVHHRTEVLELKKKIFETFSIIRIYTKEPRKESTGIPMIMEPDSTVKDVAEKILTGLSKKVKKTRIWGPSSKFPGQTVGLDCVLKDKDIVEFQTE